MEINETILFVSEAKVIIKGTTVNNPSNAIKTGITDKKVVITTNKLYIFDSPHTEAASTEYRVKRQKARINPTSKENIRKEFYSVTGTPQYVIQIRDSHCKVVEHENQKIKDFIVKKLGIFNNTILVKNLAMLCKEKEKRMHLIFFSKLQTSIRFARAIKVVNAWFKYLDYCNQRNCPFNLQWTILLQDYVQNDKTIFEIDPMHYHDGVNQQDQMNSFGVLIDYIQNVTGLKFKFMIKEEYGYGCLKRFILGIKCVIYMKILILSDCQLVDQGFVILAEMKEKLKGLVTLDISHNKLTDLTFTNIALMFQYAQFIKNINISHNMIILMQEDSFSEMLMKSNQRLTLNLSYNIIQDVSIVTIQKTVIYALHPPIEIIDFSFNKFTKYGQWRIFVGSMEQSSRQANMTFILYPVPFHMEIFKNLPGRKWPIRQNQADISSSFITSFHSPKTSFPNQASINQGILSKTSPKNTSNVNSSSQNQNNTLVQQAIGIKICRQIVSNKEPAKTEDLQKITKIKNQLTIMINSGNTPLQRIFDIAKQISGCAFSFPTIALQQISQYLWVQMNEALLVRDHQSIELITQSCQMLCVNINGYKERLTKVDMRKDLFCQRLFNLFNFQMNEMQLVPELEELIKQSLRLCLKGTAIDLLYYLKFLKDQKIKVFLKNQYSPYVQLQDRRTQSYAKLFQMASQSKEQIPLALRKHKQIDVDLYDYYLYANYFLLAMIKRDYYQELIKNLKSLLVTNPQFSKFIYLAMQRINFILTEFYKSFIYSVFSISYLELKINSCRLVWQYYNIKKSVLYADLPNFPKKVAISPQKKITIINKPEFEKEFSINVYQNIKSQVREHGIYGYKSIFTRYMGKLFLQEVKKLCQLILKIFQAICSLLTSINQNVTKILIQMIQFLRGCTHVNQLLEQLYVHVICFQGNQRNMMFLLQIIPVMTMYLRPPQTIESFLVSFLISHNFNFDYIPLSISFQKRPIVKFVDRDWLPTPRQMVQLINNHGKVMIPIRTTERKVRFIITIQQSKTVGDLMKMIYEHNAISEYIDKATFWIYKHNLQTCSEQIIIYDDYIGQLMSTYNQEKEQFIVRRRIYSPYYSINFHKYTDSILNSIYHEVKHFYLLGIAYTVFDDSEIKLGTVITMIDVLEQAIQDSRQITFEERDIKLFTDGLRDKIVQIIPVNTRNTRSFKIDVAISQLKEEIVSLLNQPQNITIPKLQRKFLDEFRNNHYYCASNYIANLYQQNQKCLVSVNNQFICIETITDQKIIFYESLLSLCPEEKYLNIYYYDKEKLQTIEIILETKLRLSIAIVMDILSYCVLRLYTSSIYVYMQRQLHQILMKYDYPLSAFDPDKQQRGEEAIMAFLKPKRGQSTSALKQIVSNINHIVGRLRTMELSSYKESDFIYFQQIKFSKWQLDRDVFPFRSNRILTKSQLGPKGDEKGIDDSNLDGSVHNKNKQSQSQMDDMRDINKMVEEMSDIAEAHDEEVKSPMLPLRKNELNIDINDSQVADIQDIISPNNNIKLVSPIAAEKKPEPQKLQIPKIFIPKRKQQEPYKPLIPPLIPRPSGSGAHKAQEPAMQPLVQPIVEDVVEPTIKVQQPKTQPQPETVPIPAQLPQPMIQNPPETVVPDIQIKPNQEEEIMTVIKPRNSNKMFDRASRRRNG